MRLLAATSTALLLSAPLALAQERGTVTWNARQAAENEAIQKKRMAEISARVPLERPITGAPYSADTIVESSQALADGNHINRKSTGRVYRDGQGRVRREEDKDVSVATPNGTTTNRVTSISIVDPVGGYSYSLNPEQKIAWRTPIGASKEVLDKIMASGAAGQRSSQPAQVTMTPEQKAAAGEAAAKLKAEYEQMATDQVAKANAEKEAKARGFIAFAYIPPSPPEHATIAGLAVEGHRNSETIPAGQIGNELPITITSEEWTSTDLKVLVLTKHNDPRTGESSYRLANVVRAEPDPSLFMVPADYTVKDTGIKRNNE